MYSLKTAANARANLLVKNIPLRRDILLLIETINSKINTESTVSYYILKNLISILLLMSISLKMQVMM